MEMAVIVEESERGIKERQDKLTTYRTRQGGRSSVGGQDKVYIIKEKMYGALKIARQMKERNEDDARSLQTSLIFLSKQDAVYIFSSSSLLL